VSADRRAAVAAAITARVLTAVEHGASLPVAVSAAVLAEFGANPDPSPPRERPSERHKRENDEALAMLVEVGINARTSIGHVSRQLAVDPHDPAEVYAWGQRLRRLRRKNCASGAFAKKAKD
jgi:hypothetical protein